MCVDMASVPQRPQTFEEQINAKYEEQRRFWEWNMGNGYVSASENAVMILSLFFGFMRTIDMLKELQRIEKERSWTWFWNLCEGKEDDNNY